MRLEEIYNHWKPRDNQLESLDFIKQSIESNKKGIFLNLPVGSGKSFLAMMFTLWYRENINPDARVDIITNSRLLQTQYTNDFPFIGNVWGQENYDCDEYNTSCADGREICKTLKTSCNNCPWLKDLRKFISSPVSITNFHLYILWSVFGNKALSERNSNVLIIDEAHEFDPVYCDFITVKVSEKFIEKISDKNKKITRKLSEKIESIQTENDFYEYVKDELLPHMNSELKSLIIQMSNENDPELNKIANKYKTLFSTYQKYDLFIKDFEKNANNWTIERQEIEDIIKNEKYTSIEVKPVWASSFLKKIWDKYDLVIFMSGTILDPYLFTNLVGMDLNDISYRTEDNKFPLKNRPIYYYPVGKMSYNEKKETMKKMIPVIKKILDENSNYKGIIHTGTYEISKLIEEKLGRDKRLLIYDTNNRIEMFESHQKSKSPTVLVGPSMISGVDLKDDLSRFQIITKMPYPNLSSSKIKKRMEAKNGWYDWATLNAIIQSYGRSIRNEKDWAKTYILDMNFEMFINKLKNDEEPEDSIIPIYFMDAIQKVKML